MSLISFQSCCMGQTEEPPHWHVCAAPTDASTPCIRRLVSEQVVNDRASSTPVGVQSAPHRSMVSGPSRLEVPIRVKHSNYAQPRSRPSASAQSPCPSHNSNYLFEANGLDPSPSSICSQCQSSQCQPSVPPTQQPQRSSLPKYPTECPCCCDKSIGKGYNGFDKMKSPMSQATTCSPANSEVSNRASDKDLSSKQRNRSTKLEAVDPFALPAVVECDSANNAAAGKLPLPISNPSRFNLVPDQPMKGGLDAASLQLRLERIETALNELMMKTRAKADSRTELEEWARRQIRKEELELRRQSLIEELQNSSNEKIAKRKLIAFLESSSHADEYGIAIDSAGLYFRNLVA
eukprot:Gregarina_sp_Poly_1__2035@NODE_1535_length_3909_cov_331_545549_g1012_i0_p2_GENE_NODE_1535_length_3909_cov_331_545549_g1012_i0NODE_1535_length_3909_cov_331_545549_g1012_i0_p2_ORF_typecomplete_len349_score37_56Nbs1_C/PF08599_10/1_1_NODE_1535_length_3909_cov_331_545549_g1012_i01011147